ncbi:hypothetical protein [uncultured Helicobacter sp.]|uniref:hypothetical protein n=1 Tax=uncultured Helicobacter sp. TaxID=175537 RepID=UPI0026344144|nr:hypothetical protein [uncultured Helicobacter sp.]
MKQPSFYFLLLLCAYGCIFLFPSFWLFIPALYVFFYLSNSFLKSLFWLGVFNIFIGFWLLFLVFGGEGEEALRIFWTSNLFITFALGLYCHRGAIFITQSLQNIFPKKLNLLVFLSAKLIDELKNDLSKNKQTLQVRLPASSGFFLTCKAYGYLIGKLICHGILRAEELGIMLGVRGYDGGKIDFFTQSARMRDYFAFALLLGAVLIGGCL